MQGEDAAPAAPTTKRSLKVWRTAPETAIPPDLLAVSGSEILARLLLARGVSTGELAQAFLDPGHYTPTGPEAFAAMPVALERINKAIANKEKIVVYGDYDADGVTSTCVMLSVLKRLGAEVDFYIPNRLDEGYGLNLKAVSVLASKQRAKLIITCDCGVSNFAEINLARSLGVDTIIADHHSMPEMLPPAVAILHPKQLPAGHALEHLSGVGVAYKLAEALLIAANLEEEVKDLLDLVTVGLIADLVPLVKENRYLTQIGLPALAASKRPGIRALLEQTAAMEGSELVGFGLAPKINAVGRLADASVAVKLLLSTDIHEAFELARKLETENARRQELCEQIFFEADQKAKLALARGDQALALYGATWHHGVVGIVASRLVDKYHCPTFVAQLDEEEGKLKGSARSACGVDLYEVLKANESLLMKWGGHQMAAGFSADASLADSVCSAIVATCTRMMAGKNSAPTLDIDLELESAQVSLDLAKELGKLGPFGMHNRKPVLVMKELEVTGLRALGKEGKHHRITVKSTDGEPFECVLWRSQGRVPAERTNIDVAFSAEVNTFNGRERLQLNLSDWRSTGAPNEPEQLDFSPPQELARAAVALQPVEQADASADKQGRTAPHVVRLETRYDGSTATSKVQGQPSYGFAAPAQNNGNEPEDARTEALAELTSEDEDPAAARAQSLTRPPQKITWKDLRDRQGGEAIIKTAVDKLKNKLAVFGEALSSSQIDYMDRLDVEEHQHLLIWQYPPSIDVFRSILSVSGAQTIYLVGAGNYENYDAASFLKRLLGIVRFAVSKRDGQAHIDKIASALAGSKISVALGLLILRKLHVIDYYSENSTVFLDMIGAPTESWHDLPEYKQLTLNLREVTDFRLWCAESSLDELQSALVPNAIRMAGEPSGSKEDVLGGLPRRNTNDRTSYITSGDQGQS